MDVPIELRHLRYFVAVAEELHFGRAAKRLHISQPPLSQQIRRLEEIVGAPLFFRSSRSVKLTDGGLALLDRARRTLARISEDVEAVRRVTRGEAGVLTVGFVGSAMLTHLPVILRKYREAYPRVQLRLRELSTDPLREGILEGAIDVALMRDAGPSDVLHVETLSTEAFTIAVPARHALAQRRSIPIELLRDEPFVLFPRAAGVYAWENTMRLFEPKGFLPKVVQEAPQWLTVLKLVSAGLGLTVAPACVESIASAGVVCRRLPRSAGTTGIDLACRDIETSPLVRSFVSLARQLSARRPSRSL